MNTQVRTPKCKAITFDSHVKYNVGDLVKYMIFDVIITKVAETKFHKLTQQHLTKYYFKQV